MRSGVRVVIIDDRTDYAAGFDVWPDSALSEVHQLIPSLRTGTIVRITIDDGATMWRFAVPARRQLCMPATFHGSQASLVDGRHKKAKAPALRRGRGPAGRARGG